MALLIGLEAYVHAQETTSLTQEEREAFNWFDGLGYPDTQGKCFVHVTDNTRRQTTRGFLLADDKSSFTILSDSLEILRFQKDASQAGPLRCGCYERVDLRSEATKLVAAIHNHKAVKEFGHLAYTPYQLFAFARACAANGLETPAHELCLATIRHRTGGERETLPLREKVESGLAHDAFARAVRDFVDITKTRSELHAEFESYVAHFPGMEWAGLAREKAAMLRLMVSEDEGHFQETKPKAKPADRVTELIFRLRDQTGSQSAIPGRCQVLCDDRVAGGLGNEGAGSPAAAGELAALGYEAVPQLIEHLSDRRLTRAVECGRRLSQDVLEVGDCVVQILERIAGRSFASPTFEVGKGKAASLRAPIEAWWATIQAIGEEAALVAATRSGDRNSPQQARRLLERYPKGAFDAIAAGARAACEPRVRATLVQLVGSVEGDATLEFLRGELRDGPSLCARVAAAYALDDRGRQEGVQAMIAAWNSLSDPASACDDGLVDLIGFLANSGRPEAISALASDLARRPPGVRLLLILAFHVGFSCVMTDPAVGSSPATDVVALLARVPVRLVPAEPHANGREARIALEDMLAGELDDMSECLGIRGKLGNSSFNEPRIADFAGQMLATWFPECYQFNISESLVARDLALQEVRKAARSRGSAPTQLQPR
jgi:hypothetical protein